MVQFSLFNVLPRSWPEGSLSLLVALIDMHVSITHSQGEVSKQVLVCAPGENCAEEQYKPPCSKQMGIKKFKKLVLTGKIILNSHPSRKLGRLSKTDFIFRLEDH